MVHLEPPKSGHCLTPNNRQKRLPPVVSCPDPLFCSAGCISSPAYACGKVTKYIQCCRKEGLGMRQNHWGTAFVRCTEVVHLLDGSLLEGTIISQLTNSTSPTGKIRQLDDHRFHCRVESGIDYVV